MPSEGDVLVHEFRDGEWEVQEVRGSLIRATNNEEIEYISREEYGRVDSPWSLKSDSGMDKQRIKQTVREKLNSTEKSVVEDDVVVGPQGFHWIVEDVNGNQIRVRRIGTRENIRTITEAHLEGDGGFRPKNKQRGETKFNKDKIKSTPEYEEAYDKVVSNIDFDRYIEPMFDPRELNQHGMPSEREVRDLVRDEFNYEIEPEIRTLLQDYSSEVVDDLLGEFRQMMVQDALDQRQEMEHRATDHTRGW